MRPPRYSFDCTIFSEMPIDGTSDVSVFTSREDSMPDFPKFITDSIPRANCLIVSNWAIISAGEVARVRKSSTNMIAGMSGLAVVPVGIPVSVPFSSSRRGVTYSMKSKGDNTDPCLSPLSNE